MLIVKWVPLLLLGASSNPVEKQRYRRRARRLHNQSAIVPANLGQKPYSMTGSRSGSRSSFPFRCRILCTTGDQTSVTLICKRILAYRRLVTAKLMVRAKHTRYSTLSFTRTVADCAHGKGSCLCRFVQPRQPKSSQTARSCTGRLVEVPQRQDPPLLVQPSCFSLWHRGSHAWEIRLAVKPQAQGYAVALAPSGR